MLFRRGNEMKDFITVLSAGICTSAIVAFIASFVVGLASGSVSDCKYDRHITNYNPSYRLGCFLTEKR